MESDLAEPTLSTVKAVLIMDNDGNRLVGKFYDENFSTNKEKKRFERLLYQKTHKASSEIIMLEGLTCVYRSNVDLFFYVIGSCQENEVLLANVLGTLYESISLILRKNVEKRVLLDNLDAVLLAMDNTIAEGGVFLDCDPMSVMDQVALRRLDDGLGSDQSVTDFLKNAKQQLKMSLLQ